MKPIRADRFINWLEKNNHQCFPGEIVNQRTIEETLAQKNDSQKIVITQEKIHKEIAVFTGKYNLPLNVLSSTDFYNISCDLIALGITKKQTDDPLLQSRRIYNPIGRDKLRSYLVEEAYQKHRKILSSFSDLPYACVAIDEGETVKYKNLHFILECPEQFMKPYPFDTIRMRGIKAIHYVESISNGLHLLNAANINIGTVVCDGSPAQLKAFDFRWEKSLRFKKINDIKNIIFIPCLCHRVENAYKYQAGKDEQLIKILNELQEIETFCRMNSDDLGLTCPSHCNTRWIFDYDIVVFVIDHIELIQRHYGREIPIDDLIDLKNCLTIFKTLIRQFEKTSTKFKWAFEYLERGINCLFELSRDQKNKYASCLAYSLRSYTLNSTDSGLWCLGYALTSTGRKDLRNRNKLKCNPFPKDYLRYFDFTQNIEEETDSQNYTPKIGIEDVYMTIDGVEINFDDDSDYSDDEFTNEEEEEDSVEDFFNR